MVGVLWLRRMCDIGGHKWETGDGRKWDPEKGGVRV